MKRKTHSKNTPRRIAFLYGLTFISPLTYSITLLEMDAIQKIIFLSISLLVFFAIVLKSGAGQFIPLNKFLLITLLLFPLSFFTSFLNGSADRLPLQLSNLIVSLCIILQSAVMLFILGEDLFFKLISYSIVIISTLFSFIGLLEVFGIKTIDLPTMIPPGSTLGHRGFASEYLLPSLPFFLIVKNYIKKEHSIALCLAGFINISFLLFTRSRSAMILLGFVALVYFAFILLKREANRKLVIKEKFRKIAPLALVLAAALLFSLLPAKGAQRTELKEAAATIFDTDYRSNQLRMKFWNASLQMIKENPLTGVGMFEWSGNYPKYYSEDINDETVTFVHSIHAHNDFLELFAENGIAALLVYLIIIVLISRMLLLKSKRDEKYFYVFLTVLSSVLFSLASFPAYKFSSYFLFSVSSGIALLGIKEDNNKKLLLKFSNLKTVLIVCLVIAFITSFIRLRSEMNFVKALQFLNSRMYPQMNEKLNSVSSLFYLYDPSKQPVDYYRGIANSYLKNYSEALKNNLNALELAPFNPIIFNNVATAYNLVGNTKKAIDEFEKIKSLFPDYTDPQFKLLYLYTGAKQFKKGKELLSELIARYPDDQNLIQIQSQYYSP